MTTKSTLVKKISKEKKDSSLDFSQELHLKVFENMPIGMLLIDVETLKFQYPNKAFLSLTDYKKEQVVGRTAADIKLLEPGLLKKALLQLKGNASFKDREIQVRKKNGDLFWSSLSIRVMTIGKKKYALASFFDISKRKQEEDHLDHLANIVETTDDAIISNSLDGIITSWNKGAERIYGYTEGQALKKHISLLIPKKYVNEEKMIAEKVRGGEIIKHYETVRRRKNGDHIYISLSASPLISEKGEVNGVSSVGHDITERKKFEAELLLANKELAFQNNEKEKRAAELGIANRELAYQNEEKEKRAGELFLANKELIFQTGEKEKRAAELVIADIELDYQNTEKEKREIANKELEEISYKAELASKYSLSLIEASRDPLFTISPNGKITDMNEATVKVTGRSRNELIGSDFITYFTEPEKAGEGYKEVFSKGFVADYPLTLKDHALTDVLFNGSTYKDDDGRVLGAVVVARDITDQKRIEKELIEAKVFAEFATDLAETAKGKAESATLIAENAVKAKQQFLSNMSHEIRTPMNAIIGFTKVVLKTELSVKQREYLTAIKISGDALIVLINDILDLAKVDAGKMTFEKIPFKLSSSISSMIHLFEAKIMEKNLHLVKEFDARIPETLLGDPVRLHQIILNLVSNAVKFTSRGEIKIAVRLLKESADDVEVEFAISDTGIGILETKLETIFENFQQASSGTSRLFGGTGLGLAIVKQLVEPQGGRISVKSTPGEGSTFSFVLNFEKTNQKTLEDEGRVEDGIPFQKLKVLVVEDIAINQLLMKTLLDDFGFERDIAANGRIAIEKLRTKSYDIILMDLQMPEMNGFEATACIRNELGLTIPIIALTADVTTVDITKCKAVGMNDYIAKPVDERLLYNKMVQLVKIQKLAEEQLTPEINEIRSLKYTDLSYLNLRTKGDRALMMEMIALYLEQTPALVVSMKQSFEVSDWTTLKAAAHKMIPSFAIMGLSADFEGLARKLQEYDYNVAVVPGVGDVLRELDAVCIQACRELADEYIKLKNATT